MLDRRGAFEDRVDWTSTKLAKKIINCADVPDCTILRAGHKDAITVLRLDLLDSIGVTPQHPNDRRLRMMIPGFSTRRVDDDRRRVADIVDPHLTIARRSKQSCRVSRGPFDIEDVVRMTLAKSQPISSKPSGSVDRLRTGIH